MIVMFAVGALSALSRASILAIRTDLGKEHGMGALAGLHGSAFSTGQVIGPPVSGLVADALGLFWVFPLWNVVGVGAAAVSLRWFRRWQAIDAKPDVATEALRSSTPSDRGSGAPGTG